MLETNDTGLLVVDIQGKLARIVHDSEPVIANTANLTLITDAAGAQTGDIANLGVCSATTTESLAKPL